MAVTPLNSFLVNPCSSTWLGNFVGDILSLPLRTEDVIQIYHMFLSNDIYSYHGKQGTRAIRIAFLRDGATENEKAAKDAAMGDLEITGHIRFQKNVPQRLSLSLLWEQSGMPQGGHISPLVMVSVL